MCLKTDGFGMDDVDRIRTELTTLIEWARHYQKHLKLSRGDTEEQQRQSPRELADCGASWPTIRARVDRALRRAGVLSKRRGGRPRVPVEPEQVLRMLKANKKRTGRPNVLAVAAHFGISRQTVYRMMTPTKRRLAEADDGE